MNIQEREQLSQFLEQLTQAQAAPKDGDAEALIRDACLRQPDAAYLLVQRAMRLDHAVQASQSEIARLQAEAEQLRAQLQDQGRAGNAGGSFLDANAWGNSATPAPRAPSYPAAPGPALAPSQTPAPAAAAPGAWGSGLLGNVATTAAGVVAGGFLFQGIQHLVGNHGTGPGAPHASDGNPLPEQHAAAASNPLVDHSANNAEVFDTRSVDDYIAGESGSDSGSGSGSDDSV